MEKNALPSFGAASGLTETEYSMISVERLGEQHFQALVRQFPSSEEPARSRHPDLRAFPTFFAAFTRKKRSAPAQECRTPAKPGHQCTDPQGCLTPLLMKARALRTYWPRDIGLSRANTRAVSFWKQASAKAIISGRIIDVAATSHCRQRWPRSRSRHPASRSPPCRAMSSRY